MTNFHIKIVSNKKLATVVSVQNNVTRSSSVAGKHATGSLKKPSSLPLSSYLLFFLDEGPYYAVSPKTFNINFAFIYNVVIIDCSLDYKWFTKNHSSYCFLLSSTYRKRKYWIRENFRLPVFDGFIWFERFWTRFDHFWKMSVCLFVYRSLCTILWTLYRKN